MCDFAPKNDVAKAIAEFGTIFGMVMRRRGRETDFVTITATRSHSRLPLRPFPYGIASPKEH